jgi:DNA-directed RNA polymerase specialized sigma24 family protein
MKNEWHLTQDAFDRFLTWLDPNRERAAYKYEEVRHKLIKIFTCRGCVEAEDLADETINRVIRKSQDMVDSYVGDPALYFYGVARNVHLEHVRKGPAVPLMPPADPPHQKETEIECLEQCMKKLSDEQRRWVLEYYKEDKREKIDHRKEMAVRLGIAPNALRIRMHRIRASLQGCVASCLERRAGR